MRRAQSTLEYIFLIALVAAALIATLVYIKRGLQGNLRQLSEQAGAGAYDPRNTVGRSVTTKSLTSTLVSSSQRTVTYGPGNSSVATSGTNTNTETGREVTDKDAYERVGPLASDTWRKY